MFFGIEGSYGHIVEHTETAGFTPLAVMTRGPEHNTEILQRDTNQRKVTELLWLKKNKKTPELFQFTYSIQFNSALFV